MFIVDDPLLALIVRFVTDSDELDISDEEFVKRQIQALQQYVDRFPKSEKNARAIEWIGKHAERYRREWQRKVVSQDYLTQRCNDCPLRDSGEPVPCEIHAEWLSLLDRYTGEEMASEDYVKKTLQLLQEHKNQLKHHRTFRYQPPQRQ